MGKQGYGKVATDELGEIAKKELTPNCVAVYSVLCSFAGKDKQCFPSVNTIAKYACIKRRETVFKCLDFLEEAGIIERHQRHDKSGKNTTNLYVLLLRTRK